MPCKKKPVSATPDPVPGSLMGWAVLPVKWPAQRPGHGRYTVKVALLHDQFTQLVGSGRVFWRTAQDLAAKYNQEGVLPRKLPPKCLADYDSPTARTNAARSMYGPDTTTKPTTR